MNIFHHRCSTTSLCLRGVLDLSHIGEVRDYDLAFGRICNDLQFRSYIVYAGQQTGHVHVGPPFKFEHCGLSHPQLCQVIRGSAEGFKFPCLASPKVLLIRHRTASKGKCGDQRAGLPLLAHQDVDRGAKRTGDAT